MVQQGDIREYLSRGVGNMDFSGEYAGLISNAINQGISITQKANEATIANNQIDLSTQYLAKNNEINTKYQADPTNPQREVELKEAFEALASQYKINPLCAKQWNEAKNDVYNRYKTYNAQWAEKQQYTNIGNNLKNGYDNLLNQVSMLGERGGSIDEMRLIYANGIEGLRKGAIAGLGEVTVNEFLKDANHDFLTTYISSLAQNNPLEAQRLLKDEGVRNDIGRAETLEKLNNYVMSSISNQSKRAAFDELGNSLRAMNSDEANTILSGRANLNQVMKFVETNKALPEGSKDLVLGIYNIGSTTEYVYDRDKKRILKKDEAGSGSSSGSLMSLKKLSKTQKEDLAQNLEQGLMDMFFFGEPEEVNAKKVNKNNQGAAIQGDIFNEIKKVSAAQGQIDTAWNAGIISSTQRKEMMNKYIEPLVNYFDANLQDLDEKKGVWGTKLGYDKLKKEFSTDGIPSHYTNKIREQNSMMLTAQARYYKNLDEARILHKKNNIYELENLDKSTQEEIYKAASEDAINYAKRYGKHPEIFFKKEYPQLYSVGIQALGIKDGNEVAKQVAKSIYGAEDISKVDANKVMSDAVMNTRAYKNQQAKELINSIIAVNKSNPDSRLLTDMEIEERAKGLGLTMEQLRNDAYSKRVSPQMYLIYLENLKKENRR